MIYHICLSFLFVDGMDLVFPVPLFVAWSANRSYSAGSCMVRSNPIYGVLWSMVWIQQEIFIRSFHLVLYARVGLDVSIMIRQYWLLYSILRTKGLYLHPLFVLHMWCILDGVCTEKQYQRRSIAVSAWVCSNYSLFGMERRSTMDITTYHWYGECLVRCPPSAWKSAVPMILRIRD